MGDRELSTDARSLKMTRMTYAGIGIVSLIYFADIFLKARHKSFWFDELFTVYLCRLPTLRGTWSAVSHGADFNPPLFYLLTRTSQRIFGEGLVSTRLPATIGVWLFCICLFLFVFRRTGVVSGFIAGIFPFFTLAQYYAYEARAHGITLGWCGLAIIFWQRTTEERGRNLWLAGFGVVFLGALLTHVYAVYLAVPFVVAELYCIWGEGRPNWRLLSTMAAAFTFVTLAVYLPLFHAYRATMPSSFFAASHDQLERFMVNVIGPAIPVLIFSTMLAALERTLTRRSRVAFSRNLKPELVLAIGFLFVPVMGLLGCKLSHGPFLDRYFLSSIAGVAILLGLANSSEGASSRTSKTLAGCMFLLFLGDLGATTYLGLKQRIMLIEPSNGLSLTTTPADPMKLYGTMTANDGGLDILVLPSMDYLYLFRYAPESVVSHLYFGAQDGDLFLGAFDTLSHATNLGLRTTTFGPFLATHSRFLVYSRGNSEAENAIVEDGYRLLSATSDFSGTMYEYAR